MAQEKPTLITLIGTALVLSVLAGAFAGVIAAVFTNQSLDRYIQSLRDGMRFVSISEVKPDPLPGTFEEALSRVQESAWPSMAIFTVKTEDTALASNWIRSDAAKGVGMVITSDGWIVTNAEQVESFNNLEQGAEVWIAGKRYEVEDMIKDSLTDYVLIKVEANGLSTVAFGASEDDVGGELVFVLGGMGEIRQSSIQSTQHFVGNVVAPAEEFLTAWTILETERTGAVVNSAGELIGFVGEAGATEPFHHALPFVQSVISSNKVVHAALGARTTDLAHTLNVSPELKGSVSAGALVQSTFRGVAIVEDGPAAEAGILEGDIILSIDEVLITETTTLAELLAFYEAGDSVNIELIRAGQEQILEVTLGDYQDLIY